MCNLSCHLLVRSLVYSCLSVDSTYSPSLQVRRVLAAGALSTLGTRSRVLNLPLVHLLSEPGNGHKDSIVGIGNNEDALPCCS